jgi:uncharacterized membrane protein (UPF0136 family)
MTPQTVLWVYIVLLLVGGLIGYLKAKSKASLIASTISAASLILCASGLFEPRIARALANLVMAVLLVVFGLRLSKTKKFMPSGMLLVLTIIALALRNITF